MRRDDVSRSRERLLDACKGSFPAYRLTKTLFFSSRKKAAGRHAVSHLQTSDVKQLWSLPRVLGGAAQRRRHQLHEISRSRGWLLDAGEDSTYSRYPFNVIFTLKFHFFPLEKSRRQANPTFTGNVRYQRATWILGLLRRRRAAAPQAITRRIAFPRTASPHW